jgi:glycosyltransferase involved in cell wall biosynthesis
MTDAPEIAVVLPAYNAAAYLEEAVRSVLAQTFTNFELIIVDDCSSDETPAIAQRLAAGDPRIRVIRNSTNLRAGACRNIGVSAVSSSVRYIAAMDADDRCRKDRLQRQFDFLESRSDCAFCGSSIAVMDESGTVFAEREYPTGSLRILRFFGAFNCFANPTTMFRREIFRSYRYETDRRCEDYALFFRILERHDGDNLPEILLDYRLSSTQQKSRYLKETLLDTIRIQRPYLFRRRFFRFLNLFTWLAELVLYCLPGRLVAYLFRKKYFRKKAIPAK